MSRWPAGRLLECTRGHRADFVELLRRLTLAESPSSDPASQARVATLISTELQALGMQVRQLPGKATGGALYARPRSRLRHRPLQLLLGHYDTVWPRGTLQEMPFEVDTEVARGPGVFDMKGGVAELLIALRCLQALQLEPTVTPLVLLNSDEEIGSRETGRYVRCLARLVDRALVLEPSLGPAGALKTARKGVGRFTVRVRGRAAHAGLDPEAGASAILELSHVIQKLFALNDPKRGISVNVGTVDGGIRPNVVAPESTAVVDVRVANQADAEAVQAAILAIEPETPGVELEVDGRIGRPPLEATPANRRLWLLARELGEALGLQLQEGMAGGGSDGSTTSQYTATLDGLGPVGDGAHARDEHLLIDRTLERAALVALLILAPAMTGENHEPR